MKTLFLLCFSLLSFFNLTLSQAQPDSSKKSSEIVYITKTGTKYHKAGCYYLKGGGIPKKLSELSSSYSPCSRCYPAATTKSTQTNNNNSSSGSTQTTETTKTGKPIYTGPRGGRYHYSKSGKKVYEKKK